MQWHYNVPIFYNTSSNLYCQKMTCFCLNYINNIFTSDVFNFKLFDTNRKRVESILSFKIEHWLAWFTTHILLEYSLNYFLQSIYQIQLALLDLWNDSSNHQLCLFERILQNYYCLVFFWSCLYEDIQSDFVFVPQKSAIWKMFIHA